MSSTPYFQTQQLQAHFHAALEVALEQQRLSEVEAGWLAQAAEAQLPGTMFVQIVLNACPLPGACLLIGYTRPEQPWVYQFNPLLGIRVHDSLAAAQIALHAPSRHLGLPAPRLKYVEVQGEAFEQCARGLIPAQTSMLEGHSNMLGLLPSLSTVMNACLNESFATLLAQVTERHLHPVLVVDSKAANTVACSSIGKVALERFCQQAQGFGLEHVFLDQTRQRQTAEQADTWNQAIDAAVAALPDRFAQALEQYWQATPPDAYMDRRDQLALILVNDFARAVLRAQRTGLLDANETAWLSRALQPSLEAAPQLCQLSYGELDNRSAVIHAGMLVARTAASPDQPVYLYSAPTGVRRFRNEAALKAFFLELSKQARQPEGIANPQWPDLQAATRLQVVLTALPSQPWSHAAQSITDLLARNLNQALGQPGAQASTALANVENALDIRALVDTRLPLLDGLGRWPVNARQAPAIKLVQVPLHSDNLPGRTRQVRRLGQRYAGLRALQPSIEDIIEALLAPQLAVVSEGTLRASDLQLKHDGVISSVADFFLERLTRMDLGQVLVGVDLLDQTDKPIAWPDASWMVNQLNELRTTFAHSYNTRTAAFEAGMVRLGSGMLDMSAETEAVYEALLRADLSDARDAKRIETTLLDALEQFLDKTPPAGFGLQSLYIELPDDNSRAGLSNAFVVSRLNAPDSAALQWTPQSGLIAFSNLKAMRHALDQTLTSDVALRGWATLLNPVTAARLIREYAAGAAHQQAAHVQFEPVTGDLIDHLRHLERNRRAAQHRFDLSTAIRSRFDAVLLRRYMAAQHDPLNNAIRESLETLYNKRFNALLPKWLQTANRHELTIYQTLLERCVQLAHPDFSYLRGIPEMEEYAAGKLKAALHHDDPLYPEPDQISVTLTHVEGGLVLPGQLPSGQAASTSRVTKTLTDFALTHFSELATATLSVTVGVPGKRVPEPFYLRSLVSRLDIATPYRQILASKLSTNNSDYAQRRELFAAGTQANMLAYTFQAQLEKKLTPTAAVYVATVLNSPDGLARQAVDGMPIEFSQLRLKAATHLDADTVAGMYVIGPAGNNRGPLVLYTAYQSEHILQEFKDQAELLHHLHSDKRLEALVLGNVSDEAYVRYANNGLLYPHIISSSADIYDFSTTYPPAQLALKTITGNALHYLFERNIEILISRATDRTVTRAEANWKAWRALLKLGLQEATVLIPAQLATLVNLWQSVDWLQASAEAVKKRNWGEALAEFTTALATLAISRDPNADTALDRAQPHTAEQGAANAKPQQAQLVALTTETGTQRLRQRFEAKEAVLSEMMLDKATGLFRKGTGQATYVAVQGKVYEARQFDQHWYIFSDEQRGPRIQRRGDGQWEFYLSLRGGADHGVEFESTLIERDLQRIFTIQAEGMAQIYANHYGHYLQLQNARTLSVHLLSTAVSNLNAWRPWDPLPVNVRSILETTFGEVPGNRVLARLREDCKILLKEILSPTLSPETSMRIVTGLNRPGRDFHLAFTYRGDPKKRIFLTELFFKIPDDVRMNSVARDSDLLAHFQASALIHELTHSILKTDDITYVDAIVPDLSVLEQQTPANRIYYKRIKDAWEKGFTAATPPEELFKTQDGAYSRDLLHKDGTALATILRLTERTSLTEAREVFHNDPQKRAELILANADSVALLICRLGQSASVGFAE